MSDYDLIPIDHDPFATPKPGQTVPPADTGQAAGALPGQIAHGLWSTSGLQDVYDSIVKGSSWTDIAGASVPLALGAIAGPEEEAAQIAEKEAAAGLKGILSRVGTGEGPKPYGFAPMGSTGPSLADRISALGGNWDSVPVMDHMGNVIRNPLSGGQNVGGPILRLNPDGSLTKGIVAYHGSPYDFDKFDLSKIGTGEGAQAFGHGLYFSEEPEVAEEYRRNLTAHPAKDFVNEQFGRAPERRGKTYQVSIAADPEHFLDWDKPLSEQHPAVQEKIRKAGLAPQEADLGEFGGQKVYSAPRWADTPEQAAALRQAGIPGIKYLDQGSRASTPIPNATIQYDPQNKVYNIFDEFGSRAGYGKTLQDAKDIRDGKQSANPTSNYVVFDDNLINIIKKYGIAGLIAGGASHFSSPAEAAEKPQPTDSKDDIAVGSSMSTHLRGNQSAGPGPNPAEAFWDWRQAGGLAGPGNSWADRMGEAMRTGDRQAQIDLLGGLGVAGMARPVTPPGFAENLAKLVAKGLGNQAIADALGVGKATVWRNRAKLGLDQNPTSVETGAWSDPKNEATLREMHAKGASDREIGDAVGLFPGSIAGKRARLGLEANNPQGGSGGPLSDPTNVAILRQMHASGASDRQIGAAIGTDGSQVNKYRQKLGLPANNPPGGYGTRRWGGTDQGFAIPMGRPPSMPKISVPDPGFTGDPWLMENLGYHRSVVDDLKKKGYKLTPVEHDPFKEDK